LVKGKGETSLEYLQKVNQTSVWNAGKGRTWGEQKCDCWDKIIGGEQTSKEKRHDSCGF